MTTTAAGKERRFLRPATLWVSVLLVVLPVAYFVYSKYKIQHIGLDDFFALLGQQGYAPNIGFSGVFRPGNIIQIAEAGSDGKDRQLATPMVIAWGDKCFPGLSPRTLEFTLPQFQGQSSANLTLSGNTLARMLPALNLTNNAVANYSLTLQNTRIQAFAKTDLSSEFSPHCVATLQTAIDAGDKVDWLRVVVEAIVADALMLQVDWKDNASTETRQDVANQAMKSLSHSASQTASASDAGKESSQMKVMVAKSDTKQTTISAQGFVIVGYRARSFQPVLAK